MNIEEAINNYNHSRSAHPFRLRGALVDMDGVLYDSMPRHTLAWARLAAELGIPAERNEFYLYEGMTGADTINLIYSRTFGSTLDRDTLRELYTRKSQYFAEQGEPQTIPGTSDILQKLHNAGIITVLVTGSGQDSVLQRIERDYPGVFPEEKRVTAHDVTHGKPDPEPYVRGMEKAQLQPWESMVIENAPLGVTAARRAGCFTVAVATGPIPSEKLYEAGADIVFPSMPAFANEISSIISTKTSSPC